MALFGIISISVNSATPPVEELPEPGTPYRWSGVKVQYSYFYSDPSTSRAEWGWNGQSWWDVIIERLRPSVFVYDIIGDWYEYGNGTKNVNKYETLKSWSKKLAEYAQRDNVIFILIIGNARDTNIGIEGIIADSVDILDYISPYPVAWFGLDVEWTNPTPTEDVALSLSSLNDTVYSKGSRFCMLYTISSNWSVPFKNIYPVLKGTNAPAEQGVTRTPESPYGLWEITLLDDFSKGFGMKVGLYRPNMADDWNDTIVVKAFDWADQTNNIGILSPNIDVGLLNKQEFTNAWVREASNRGYLLVDDISSPPEEQPELLRTLNIYSSPINDVSFTINGTIYVTPLSVAMNEGTYVITMPESTTENGTTYNFKNWDDNSTNPTRTINLSSNMSLTAYYEKATGPPDTHVLSISSSPVAEIPFTLNGTEYTTSWSNTLAEATYIISMPSNVEVGNITYNFVEWEDKTVNPTRTINLTADMAITAYFEAASSPVQSPPPDDSLNSTNPSSESQNADITPSSGVVAKRVPEFESLLIVTSFGAVAYLVIQRKFNKGNKT